jgi:ABC-type nickel/cobalt efflux system permease component RcnA
MYNYINSPLEHYRIKLVICAACEPAHKQRQNQRKNLICYILGGMFCCIFVIAIIGLVIGVVAKK